MNCGACGLSIHEAEAGLRYFGFYTAHSEARCVELLKLEIAGLRDSLSAAERERDIAIDTRNLAQAASSEAVLARQKLQAELDRLGLAYCALEGQYALAGELIAEERQMVKLLTEKLEAAKRDATSPAVESYPAIPLHQYKREWPPVGDALAADPASRSGIDSEDWNFHPERGAGHSRDHGAKA
jgi:hypothetical protein